MALPDSRNTTYAAGSEVKSSDLNDVQDKIVDGAAGRRNELAPAAIGGTVNDWAPAGLDVAGILIVPLSAAATLTGIVPSVCRTLVIVNGNAANSLTLKHDDAGSTGGNQIYNPAGVDIVLGKYQSATLTYSPTLGYWLVTATSP